MNAHVVTASSTDDRDRLAFVLAMHLLHIEAQPLTVIVAPTRAEAKVVWDKVAVASSNMVRRISRALGNETIETNHGAKLRAGSARTQFLRGSNVDRLIVLSGDQFTPEQRAALVPALLGRPDGQWWEFNAHVVAP